MRMRWRRRSTPNCPYDTVKDFAGITMTASGPALLLVPPALGVKTTKDLIALAKAKPGQFNFSSAGMGSGTHFAGELFKNMAGIDVVHVPFKGIPEAITETMAGRVQFFHVAAGQRADPDQGRPRCGARRRR